MVCVASRGHVAVWRIKLAAVVYRLPPPVHLLYAGPKTPALFSRTPPQPNNHTNLFQHPQPLTNPRPHATHTVILNSCNIHQQPSHDTIYSVQPLLPRVLWLSSMQISHVLIARYLFFLWKREKKGGKGFLPELIRWLSKKKKKTVQWCGLRCHLAQMFVKISYHPWSPAEKRTACQEYLSLR